MDETNPGKHQTEGENSVEIMAQRNVIMRSMEILSCYVCLKSIRLCDRNPPKEMCKACSGPFSQRAYGMERVLANILVPCKYECGETASCFYENKEHETFDCLRGPDGCQADGCDYAAPKLALLDHMFTVHKWPTTRFMYDVQFDLPAVPGYRLLRSEEDDDHVFLLNVSDSLNNGALAVYLHVVGQCHAAYDFGCLVSVTWKDVCQGRSQHRSGWCEDIILMKDEEHCMCIFPRRCDLVLKIIIDKRDEKCSGAFPKNKLHEF